MTFHEVAKNIIRESIQSAIFIDDRLITPFENSNDTAAIELSKNLYKSFVCKNISFDFYKYKPNKNWKEAHDYLFRGRDLIILDWQLDNNRDEKNTLDILRNAVNTPSLHFVCIYTHLDRTPAFQDIIYSISAYFSEFTPEDIDFLQSKINSINEEGAFDYFNHQYINDNLGLFKEYVLYQGRRNEMIGDFINNLKAHLGNETYKTLIRELIPRFGNLEKIIEVLTYLFGKAVLNEEEKTDIRIYLDDDFLYLNHTIVLLSNKTSQTPSSLYTFFNKAVLNASGNFLSLMSLEINNLFRNSSAFMNKEVDSISEAAFFYHKNQLKPSETFYEFLLELWKSELTSILYKGDQVLLKIFDDEVLQNYLKKRGLIRKVNYYQNKKDSNQQLAKLNYYYNIVNTQRGKDDFLRFGDVFVRHDGNGPINEFYLCITAHCDCLYPELKLRSQFYFVKGAKTNLENALIEGDTGFNSYVKFHDEIVCIKWKDKPFTIHLPNNHVLGDTFSASIESQDITMGYLCTLKENYTQRIANEAFTYPLHVGIYFADKK